MTAIRRFLPSGALLTAEILDPARVQAWLAAILDRYPDSPEPAPGAASLADSHVPQGLESYLLTRWIDTAGVRRIVTARTASHADPHAALDGHAAEVAALMRRHPVG